MRTAAVSVVLEGGGSPMAETARDDRKLSVTGDDGVTLPAAVSLPVSVPIRGGLAALHPAGDPSREQCLFRQLADLLPSQGVAVLRFDRRTSADGHDVPLVIQARDALAALRTLRQKLRRRGAEGDPPPLLGLWGFSQGAWAAPLAATLSTEVAFLVLAASTKKAAGGYRL